MGEDILIATEFINLNFMYGGKVAFTTEQIKIFQKAVANIINKNEELENHIRFYEKHNSYKARILELEEENKCLHCGKNVAGYCEECYQELIGENAKLDYKILELASKNVELQIEKLEEEK